MNIYTLFVGKYSGRDLVGVFDEGHKSEAERIARLIGGEVYETPLMLNTVDLDQPPDGMVVFDVEMGRSGETIHAISGFPLNENGKRHSCWWSQTDHSDCSWERKSYWRLRAFIYAKDEKHAVKIVNEIRIQILAKAKPKTGTIG